MNEQFVQTKIPVTILTGFLGAGKTTLLNYILQNDLGIKIAILVNDFGKINIDSQLIVEVAADDTIELANGCICCTIRGDLLNALIKLTQRAHPPGYIIIEASGVSDPLEIAMTFRQPELAPYIVVDSVLTVIDAEQVLELKGENKVMAVLQVGAADIILLNKIDLVNANQLTRVKNWIYSIIPDARTLETAHGRVPLDLILNVGKFTTNRLLTHQKSEIHVHEAEITHNNHPSHDHKIAFATWSWQSDQPVSLATLKRTINRLPNGIVRVKGIVHFAADPSRIGQLQVVGKRASITWGEQWKGRKPTTQIIVIGNKKSVDAKVLQEAFDKTLVADTPISSVKDILSWVRNKLL